MSQDFKAQALAYAAMGWHVFPLRPGQKEPINKHGSSEATTNVSQIEAWWDKFPQANIGFNPMKSGIVVLDMDPRNEGDAGFSLLEQTYGDISSHLKAQSGRGTGFHLYFQAKDEQRYMGTPGHDPRVKFHGLDIKHNGYVVLPPSIHPDTHQPYTWVDGEPMVAWLLPIAPECLERPVRSYSSAPAREVSPSELPAIKEALTFLDASDNDTWVNAMASLTHWGDSAGCDQEAFEAFCEWSATSEKPEHADTLWEIEKRWPTWSSKEFGGRTIASIYHEAKLKGFRPGPDAKAAFDLMHKMMGMQQAAPVAEALNTPAAVTFTPGKYEPLSELQIEQVHTMNDHLFDAGILRDAEGVFRKRLGGFEDATHWWNGRAWEFAPDKELRRAIGVALVSTTVKTSSSRVKGTLEVLKDHLVRYGQADLPSAFVFFENGVLDPGTGQLSPHAPAYRNSRTLNAEYDPAAQCVKWQAWLADIFRSEPERISLLQEMIGWCLCRDHLGIEKAMIFIGPPRSGKGTIIKVIRALLGKAAGAFALPNLDDDKVLSGLRGQNVSIDSDTASPAIKNARQVGGLFKTISSNEPVGVRLLFTQEPWQGPLNCKLLLASNSIPTLFDDSGAVANRWIPLAFNRSFLDHEQIDLADTLLTELPGIAVWAVQGLQRLQRNGRFTLPASSRDELGNMIVSGSPIESYINERLIIAPGQRMTEAEVWNDYVTWYQKEGLEPITRRAFIKSMTDALRSRGATHKQSIKFPQGVLRGFDGAALPSGNVTPLRSV